MLDIRLIRQQPDYVKAEVAKTHTEAPIDEIVTFDEQHRALLTEVEQLRSERNTGSKETGKKEPGADRDAHIARMRELGDRIQEIDARIADLEKKLNESMLLVPNIPEPDVPLGEDESENVVIGNWGTPKDFGFEPQPHWDLGEALGMIDFERGIKVAGSRFYMLRGAGARLQRALISWFLDLHLTQHGYTEVYPPYLVTEEALIGSGNLPKFGDAQYRDNESGLWMIPTAEVPLVNMYRDEILDEAQLPILHCAVTACFRREQFSAGRDVRGIKRGHQFDKVEMVKFTTPETSNDALGALVREAADVLERLQIPYRTVQMCTGDLSFVAAKKIDLEAWAPGAEEWLEVTSCSNVRDFQARRANIRYRPEDGGRTEFVHTLNGSGLALPRTLIAVMENYQREDGSILIPEVLQPYMGGLEVISAETAR